MFPTFSSLGFGNVVLCCADCAAHAFVQEPAVWYGIGNFDWILLFALLCFVSADLLLVPFTCFSLTTAGSSFVTNPGHVT